MTDNTQQDYDWWMNRVPREATGWWLSSWNQQRHAQVISPTGRPVQVDGEVVDALRVEKDFEIAMLKQALAESGIALEVLGHQIAQKPYREMTVDFQKQILKSRDAVRVALGIAIPESKNDDLCDCAARDGYNSHTD